MDFNEQNSVACHTLNDLISALSEEERSTYNHIFRSCALPVKAFKNHESWSLDCYTRNYIAESDRFELILLCWEPGQLTPIRGHGGEECWVKIIEGEFKETIYKPDPNGILQKVTEQFSTANDVSYMIDFMGYHRLENLSDSRSMSLHLYAKPIRSCHIFDEEKQEIVIKDLTCDTILS